MGVWLGIEVTSDEEATHPGETTISEIRKSWKLTSTPFQLILSSLIVNMLHYMDNYIMYNSGEKQAEEWKSEFFQAIQQPKEIVQAKPK